MSERDEDSNTTEDADTLAAVWFHRLQSASATHETQQLLRDWLDQSPKNAEAFARTTALWEEIGEHAAVPEMMALRQEAIADFRSAGLARWQPNRGASQNRWSAALAASLIVLVGLAAAGYYLLRAAPPLVYATDVAEREAITLSDNSRVDIDANSAISVEFTPTRRLVHVVRGQAYFTVEKDPMRPFIVECNARNVIATGTVFDVERIDKGVRVTLVEGHVTVRAGSAAIRSEDLNPNDQLTDETGNPPVLVHLASTLQATAWRQGKLLFNRELLKDAVARVNRYSHTEVVADPSVAGIRIGGAFDAGNVTAFVTALTSYYPIDAVSDRPGELRLVRRKGSPLRY
jgi:transmembrane sensor